MSNSAATFLFAQHMSGRKAASTAFSQLFRRSAKSSNVKRGFLVRGGPINQLGTSKQKTTPRPFLEPTNTLATRAQKQTRDRQNEVNRLRKSGEWREPRFLQTYHNKHDVKDWVMSRIWAERAFLPGIVQDYPPGGGESTFVNDDGDVFGPGRVGNTRVVWATKVRSGFGNRSHA